MPCYDVAPKPNNSNGAPANPPNDAPNRMSLMKLATATASATETETEVAAAAAAASAAEAEVQPADALSEQLAEQDVPQAAELQGGGQRPNRSRLAPAKSVAVGKIEPFGEPPIAPPRARKRQSMPFVRRGNAGELEAVASAETPIKPLSECPTSSIAEIDCAGSSTSPPPPPPTLPPQSAKSLVELPGGSSDEIRAALETVKADNVSNEMETHNRQPVTSVSGSGGLSSLFTKLLGKLPPNCTSYKSLLTARLCLGPFFASSLNYLI